jgi:hypothetical protein
LLSLNCKVVEPVDVTMSKIWYRTAQTVVRDKCLPVSDDSVGLK